MAKAKRIFWDTAAGFNNPASIHREGLMAEKAVEEARSKIAEVLQAHPDEIIFTGSGTESDNLAILGLAEAVGVRPDVRKTTSGSLEVAFLTSGKSKPGHIITTAIEHKAVLEPCRHLQRKGFRVTYLKVDKTGQVDLKELKESLTKDTFLVSVMMANNEIGTIQPIREIAKIIRQFRKANPSTTLGAGLPYFHTDACQAPRFLDLNVAKLGVDLLAFNGSKIYGPQGVGVLYVRRGVLLAPIILGGGQEKGLRSGTLNVEGIVGLAKALTNCEKERVKESARLEKIQKKLITELQKIPGVTINGGLENRLPNNINFSVDNLEGEQLVLELDAKGFAVSSGSACSHDSGEGSYAIRAIGGFDKLTTSGLEDRATSAVRVSLPREVSLSDVTYFIKSLKEIITKYNKINL
ncbi:MAG TPA: cysteine desulfurase family protein [Candidatus Paceibacterota bacterium]|nr:cysteine desulfurase family protein [Candidatus Paceibacterota bacterium]